ncbi:MAG: DUF1003 domain-containing protein [bacterium]|nr:DUF1003 domain-containing protein [bacterium]
MTMLRRPHDERVPGICIPPSIFGYVCEDKPDFTNESHILRSELGKYEAKRVEKLLLEAVGQRELTSVEREVLDALLGNELINDTPTAEEDRQEQIDKDQKDSLGSRLADKVARKGGSWGFIVVYMVFIAMWMVGNSIAFTFDVYPFIFLNLILSCLAALQAPIILMSQNRQEAKDRARAKNDYKVNLKAEIEVQLLTEKIDHLTIMLLGNKAQTRE